MAKTSRTRSARVIASAGHQGATVSIVPRDGYPSQAQAQWYHPDSRKRQRRTISGVTLKLDGTAASKEQSTLLQQVASLLHTRLINRDPMPGEPGCPPWVVLLSNASPKRRDQAAEVLPGMLTVREALTAAYGPSFADKTNARGRISGSHIHEIKGKASGGLAVSTWTKQARDLRRLADKVESLLGPDAPWQWSEAAFVKLRDALIQAVASNARHTESPQKLRRVHKVLQTYIRATRLVQKAYRHREDVQPRPQALTVERWLTDVKEAWTAAGLLLPEGEQPRYTRAEAGQIYVEGTSGQFDPRYGLWLELGLEGRPVQILRARRSHLEEPYADTPRGVFRGPGTRLKHGLIYAPTPGHRVKIDEYLNGYLAQYEQRYLAGEIEDYPLFPSGELGTANTACFRPDVRPWNYRQFLGDAKLGTGFYAIERRARVENVPGRGPYGLKYAVADLAPLVAGRLGIGDAVAINLATAHDTPGTAPQYRRKVRTQSSMLVTVGRIIWEVRRDLREAARAADQVAMWGIGPEDERIKRYRVGADGVSVQTMRGENLLVPWLALFRIGGADPTAVYRMLENYKLGQLNEIDAEAREIRFTHVGVTMRLEPMLRHARGRQPHGPEEDWEPELRPILWGGDRW